MTEKVKLTQEQADALESVLSRIGRDRAMDANAKNDEWKGVNWGHLNDLSNSTMAKAIYIGYEVKPEYEAGQWIVDKEGTVGKIDKFKHDLCFAIFPDGTKSACPTKLIVRHATPEEIWWAERGRKVWELRKKDVLLGMNSGMLYAISTVYKDISVGFSNGTSECVDSVKKRYKVVCLAENREDVSEDG